jgi:hypothetical protein
MAAITTDILRLADPDLSVWSEVLSVLPLPSLLACGS